MLFNKNFLHLKPAWKNPPQFNQEPIVKKKKENPKTNENELPNPNRDTNSAADVHETDDPIRTQSGLTPEFVEENSLRAVELINSDPIPQRGETDEENSLHAVELINPDPIPQRGETDEENSLHAVELINSDPNTQRGLTSKIDEENSLRTVEIINSDPITQCGLTSEIDKVNSLRTVELINPDPNTQLGLISKKNPVPGTEMLISPGSHLLREICQPGADYKALFQLQEKCRFEQPFNPFTFIINEEEYVVGAIRKEPKQRMKTFGSLMTEPRPASVSALSLVRDAIARLPNGVGSVNDVTDLLSYSQYIKKSSKIIDLVVYCIYLYLL
ncbi:hypothetical protein OUZ56_003008 [Daphnia magna]|uniref:Nuclear factor related to kappa-B-binding protein second winged helix domain-containing protein n=3 Tax=Daphnia magna TaxID=35525 RepID=A0ABR0A7F3_9CRUS|nr:hypothetical protein OUZ56_003008 [Daphnia magna]